MICSRKKFSRAALETSWEPKHRQERLLYLFVWRRGWDRMGWGGVELWLSLGDILGRDRQTYNTDMEFVKNFTPPDFQAKNCTPSISPNFNSFSEKKHKNWVKMEKFTPLAKTLHCRRQWREWQIPPLVLGSLRNARKWNVNVIISFGIIDCLKHE